MRDGELIAVDWGSSNRRAYRLAADGTVIDRIADDRGVLTVPAGDFPAEVAAIRARLGPAPMLLAGMVGSSRGWIEVPYCACPLGLPALARAIHWAEPGMVGIVPGVAIVLGRADVMRGEEVQALGAVRAGLVPAEARLCHPGTHAKWIDLSGGAITGFRTTMTGEIFALLRTGSILADHLRGEVAADGDFGQGVQAALAGGSPLSELFGIRARALTGQGGHGASFASGFLIGCDVREAIGPADGPIALVGEPGLCALYAAAIGMAGGTTIMVDGGEAFRAGIRALVETL